MIILDASTIILLAKIGILETFVSNFPGQVLIPEKVRGEVCIKEMEETPLIERLIKERKIYVAKIRKTMVMRQLMDDFSIDVGEAGALTLAVNKKDAMIATDDRNAIRASKLLKIGFTTAIAILVRTFEKDLIDKEEALIKLQKLESIARYSRAIIEDAKKNTEGSD
jgi:predicted nucleic acid-binding protein